MKKNLLIRIWIVCSLGLFIDGFDMYITSIAEPFFKQSLNLTPLWIGITQSAAPIGAAIGAIFAGRITDALGRKTMLVFNFFLFVIAAILSALAWDVYSLCLFRFFVGLGVGADYPICAAYMTEMAPNQSRAKLVAAAMFINCLASPIGVMIAYLIFMFYPHYNAWRFMFAFGAVPALFALFMRARLPESFMWKISQVLSPIKTEEAPYGYSQLFRPFFLKGTIAVCLCWFFMDISYYGIGLFTPEILNALHIATNGNFMSNTLEIVKSTIFVNLFVAFGALLSIFMIDKFPRSKLQKMGFFGAFLSLLILSISNHIHFIAIFPLIFTCFLMYNIFINMGPGITTYLLPTEIYPTTLRGTGHGIASGAAKLGAFIGTIFLPEIQQLCGIYITVLILSFALFLGFVFTFLLKRYEYQEAFELSHDDYALSLLTTDNLHFNLEIE